MTVTISLAHANPKMIADSLLFQVYVVDNCTEDEHISKLDTAEFAHHLE